MAADLNNAPLHEKKALYREQNCFEISENAPVFRIFQFRYLAEDIRKKQLTHVKPEAWNDPLENPLLNHTWTEPTGERVSLRGILDKLFGQSWTFNHGESRTFWHAFSHGKTAVRIQTTAGKLLNGVMSLENRFYMLSHFIGKVWYHPPADIIRWVNNSHYTDFLDSLGQGAVLSLMALRDNFAPEEEARLVYWRQDQADNDWVAKNVAVDGNLCRVPFDWANLIDEVVIGPDTGFCKRICVRMFFRWMKIRCPIRKSSL